MGVIPSDEQISWQNFVPCTS